MWEDEPYERTEIQKVIENRKVPQVLYTWEVHVLPKPGESVVTIAAKFHWRIGLNYKKLKNLIKKRKIFFGCHERLPSPRRLQPRYREYVSNFSKRETISFSNKVAHLQLQSNDRRQNSCRGKERTFTSEYGTYISIGGVLGSFSLGSYLHHTICTRIFSVKI